ncbi:hypothetical protein KUCAC02_013195 [Chaenocephalus aceratus]|uniref:Uncharacterized protein n=1 Tax=Chaenocephalus aceratus TaxID=36190 RepID=A0ACB9XE35_CHAAC|nr:hypothetical protein KUCAC02_013195 [Chaenocephalus aceratus]
MKELAAENAALMEQTASKELPDDLLVSTMFVVKCDMVEALEFARASQKMFHAQHMKSNRTSKEHEETRFMTEILHTQRMEIEKREISKMKTVQQEIEKKVSQVLQEKEDEITRVRGNELREIWRAWPR